MLNRCFSSCASLMPTLQRNSIFRHNGRRDHLKVSNEVLLYNENWIDCEKSHWFHTSVLNVSGRNKIVLIFVSHWNWARELKRSRRWFCHDATKSTKNEHSMWFRISVDYNKRFWKNEIQSNGLSQVQCRAQAHTQCGAKQQKKPHQE